MTGPMDDHALRAGLARLAEAPGLDADVLAAGAMRRGRQRRQRSRGALASVAAVAALAVAVPSLAAPGSSDDQPVQVASSGPEHDEPSTPPKDDKRDTEVEVEETTTTTVVEEEPTDEPEPAKEPEPDVEEREAPPVTEKPHHPETPPTTEKPAPPAPELELLELWCGRGTGEEAGGVVCEVTLSEHPRFASYELRRRCADEVGKPWAVAATYGKRQMPERPWPDIRFFDEGGDPEYPWHYQVLVRDAEGKVIGKSNLVEVGAAEAI